MLTQREKLMLKDALKHEKICIAKYGGYARGLQDQELAQMFDTLQKQEERHAQTISSLLGEPMAGGQSQAGAQSKMEVGQIGAGAGQMNMAQASTGQAGMMQAGMGLTGAAQAGGAASPRAITGLSDQQTLEDMLMTEKYVADNYNMTVLESASPQVRQALQHIQKEEQQHAEQIFNGMSERGWYNPQ